MKRLVHLACQMQVRHNEVAVTRQLETISGQLPPSFLDRLPEASHLSEAEQHQI